MDCLEKQFSSKRKQLIAEKEKQQEQIPKEKLFHLMSEMYLSEK
jgi:hypothetical protein